MGLGLYIHIPFCVSRCPYCDFAFVVRKGHLAERYADAVIREFHNRLPDAGAHPVFRSIYFGGGTPSSVPPEHLQRILLTVRENADISPGAETTAEANPGDRGRFATLRHMGVNRLSLGIQALDDRTLKALGRLHNAADARDACRAARNAGFENVNIDLIFGASEQSLCGWQDTLDRAIALHPEHLSVYGLTVEPGTAFGRRLAKGRLSLPPEEDQAAMYGAALDRLTGAGYRHYEISNFARPGFEAQHNLDCWQRRPYLGVGLSAHSFLSGRRSWNVRDLASYIDRVESSGSAVESEEDLSPEQRFMEQLMLGLRQTEGVPEALVCGFQMAPALNRLLSNHLLERHDGRVRLTRSGLLLADLVCAELVKET